MKKGVDYIGITCVFFCHDGKGNVLLHKRSNQCRDEHGRWDCGAGALEFGEDPLEAVRREVIEEYLTEPLSIQFVESSNVLREHNGLPTHWIALLYVVELDPSKVGIGEPEKVDEIGWFPAGEFPDPCHSMMDRHFDAVRHFIVSE